MDRQYSKHRLIPHTVAVLHRLVAAVLTIASIPSMANESDPLLFEGHAKFYGKPVTSPYTCNFSATIDSHRWQITIIRDHTNAAKSQTIFSDGTNIYEITEFPTEAAQHNSSKKPAWNTATAAIHNGDIYRSIFAPEAAVIWLTYASGHYFRAKAPTNSIDLVHVYDVRGPIDTTHPQRSLGYWNLSPTPPFFPTKVAYYSTYTSHEENGLPQITNAVFETEDWGHFEDHRIPLRASLKTFQYHDSGDNHSSNISLFSIYELTTTNTSPAQPLARPSVPGNTVFKDNRFQREHGAVMYAGTHWFTQDEVSERLVQPPANSHPELGRPSTWLESNNEANRRNLLIPLALLCFSVIFPIVTYFLIKKNKHSPQSS